MKRIDFQNTWGYADFITLDEQSQLLEWIHEHEQDFRPTFRGSNPPGPYAVHRKCYTFKTHVAHPYPLIQTIKQRVINAESIGEWIPDPMYSDYIGYIFRQVGLYTAIKIKMNRGIHMYDIM